MRDPYSVLGVKRDAGADEIKAAWRSIAKAVHPDHNKDDPDAANRFAEIGQAYDVLKDPKKRGLYDQARQMAETKKREQTIMQQRETARQAAERAKAAKANAERVMEELARANAEKARMQNASTGAAQQTAGAAQQAAGAASRQADRNESAEEAMSRIFGARDNAAASQGGMRQQQEGAKGAQETTAEARPQPESPAAAPADVPATNAAAPLPLQAVDFLASFVRRIRGIQPPPEKAPDTVIDVPVTIDDILGEKWITAALPEGRDIRFALEAGATDGHVLRLKGQGLKLHGMQRGDVVVTLRVDPSGPFRVKGADIHTILPVSLENAVLGCETIAQSPAGPVEVTVPAWSGSDQVIRLGGRGLADGKGGRGDLVVEIRLMLWEKPDEKVTDLMRSMREGLFL